MFDELFSRDAEAMKVSPIRALAKVTADSSMISLAGGFPSPESFPIREIKEILFGITGDLKPGVLQYGQTLGYDGLRNEVVNIMKKRGVASKLDEVMICSGSQRGLDLIGRILLDPDDIVIVEVPSYPGAITCFRNLRARMVGVPQDSGGMRVDLLEETLERLGPEGKRVKLIYTIPNFQNPSGATLAPDRRRDLIELAHREELLILEDDPYGELYFREQDRELLRPLAAMTSDRLVYISSFSKILAPGLRTAFIRGPVEIISRLEMAAQASDICTSTLDQQIIYEYCRRGLVEKSMDKIRSLYRRNGATLLTALEKTMPEGAEWNEPRGGFFMWMRLPEVINTEEMLQEALKRNVAYVPGKPFCVDGSGSNELRLTFSRETPERLEEGAQKLAETIKEQLAGARK